jgi:hypothetical protein
LAQVAALTDRRAVDPDAERLQRLTQHAAMAGLDIDDVHRGPAGRAGLDVPDPRRAQRRQPLRLISHAAILSWIGVLHHDTTWAGQW